MTVHGGDVWQVGEELGIAVPEILDFSANINPRGLPPRARERLERDASDTRLLSFYPDPSARRLREGLSEQLGVTREAIVIGPGSESLLAPILRYLQPERALVPVPAFGEYRRVCEQEQIEFSPFPLDRSELFRMPVERLCDRIGSESPDAALLNNPHNPSGAMLDAHEVRRVGDIAITFLATLLVDEAFIDYVPEASLVRDAAIRPGLIVLRSLTKFYGCPALRVGYAVAHPDTIRAIRSMLPTWPVTQLAIDTLAEAVADREYAEASRRENAIERERLADSLSGLGLAVFPSAANYLLLELQADMPTASELRARLIAKHRILIRNCDSYEGLAPGRYVRVAVRAGDENCLLTQALAEELRVP
jgi:histidinol-phosphate/aromatic aminotransferase/cobyric acid decarboxylase-like protein